KIEAGAAAKALEKLQARSLDDATAARLVFADSLIEKGDPRGELIVIECALEATDLPRNKREELDARRATLVDGALAAWAKALPFPAKSISLSRGLPVITVG